MDPGVNRFRVRNERISFQSLTDNRIFQYLAVFNTAYSRFRQPAYKGRGGERLQWNRWRTVVGLGPPPPLRDPGAAIVDERPGALVETTTASWVVKPAVNMIERSVTIDGAGRVVLELDVKDTRNLDQIKVEEQGGG